MCQVLQVLSAYNCVRDSKRGPLGAMRDNKRNEATKYYGGLLYSNRPLNILCDLFVERLRE